MKKWLPIIIIAVLAIGIYSWAKNFNNQAVVLQEDANYSLLFFK